LNIKIRDAELKDLNKILEILNHEILHSTSVYDYEKKTFEQQYLWFKKKATDNMPVIIAEINDVVVGFGSFGIFRPWQAYQYSVEHSIYVDKKAQGKGIGKKLLGQLINLATQQKYKTMIAGVDATNKNSIEFHKKVGFVEVGIIKKVGHKFDRWLDLCFLQLMLHD
jgi:phosphinothricin acetyltransferase